MKTYLDTSALVKLVVAEHESTALRTYLRDVAGPDTLFTSALSRTELVRAVAGAGPAAIAQARRLLSETSTVNLTRRLLDNAAVLQPPRLRSLDAIHIAAARTAGSDLRALLTYDKRTAGAALDARVFVLSPE